MKSIILFLFLITILTVVGFKVKQTKYLPIYISLNDSIHFRPEILLNLKGAFISKKIKVITKEETLTYIKNESYSAAQDYYKSGGDMGDFDKQKRYLASHMGNVANNLSIDLSVSAEGIVGDTVKWYCYPLPINFENPPKKKWRIIILDSTNSNSLLQITRSIADSIISSNVLTKE